MRRLARDEAMERLPVGENRQNRRSSCGCSGRFDRDGVVDGGARSSTYSGKKLIRRFVGSRFGEIAALPSFRRRFAPTAPSSRPAEQAPPQHLPRRLGKSRAILTLLPPPSPSLSFPTSPSSSQPSLSKLENALPPSTNAPRRRSLHLSRQEHLQHRPRSRISRTRRTRRIPQASRDWQWRRRR